MSLPVVYSYADFRHYLADYAKAREEVEPAFSRSAFCRALGLPKSRSYLNDVIHGKKVTPGYVERFVKALGLSPDEAQFFRVLVRFNQAENPEERELFFEQLIGLNKTPKRIIDKKAYSFFSTYRHSVVRAVLDVIKCDGRRLRDLARALCPPIRRKEAKESIDLLLEHRLIARDPKGYLVPTEATVGTSDYIRAELVKQFQMQCIDAARRTLARRHGYPQTVTTNTISISREGYKRLQRKIERFRAEVRSLIQKDDQPADRVYQLNIQLFPAAVTDGLKREQR